MHSSYVSALFLCAALTLASCDNNVADPAASRPSTVKGTITTLNECGDPTADQGGVAITIENALMGTTTIADGSFTIENVPAGAQTITISKPGYLPGRIENIQLQGKGATLNVTLRAAPTWRIESIAAASPAADSIVQVTVAPDYATFACEQLKSSDNIELFISDRPDVSNTSFLVATDIQTKASEFGPPTLNVYPAQLRSRAIASGTKLYAVAYPAHGTLDVFSGSVYASEQRNVGSHRSQVISFTAP